MKSLPNRKLLTSQQIEFFEIINANPSIYGRFKFSGGTALTTFYVPYRYSDDLGFSLKKNFNHQIFQPLFLLRKAILNSLTIPTTLPLIVIYTFLNSKMDMSSKLNLHISPFHL